MKRNKIRNGIFAAVMALSAVSMTSCTDLTETVYSELPGNTTFTKEQIQAQYGVIYDRLRDMYNGWESYQDISEECCDLIMTPFRYETSGWGAQYVSLHKHEFNSTINHLYRPWMSCYQGITTCNQLLDDANISSNDESKAELRAYRALFYYVLFDLWRNIPVQTTLKVPNGYMPSQADPDSTYNFIVNELNEAKPFLPKTNELGQMNYWTACMILAKMYLNRNAWFPTKAEDKTFYEKAYKEVNEVINSGVYQLDDDYLTSFKAKVGGVSSSKETIFALVYDSKYAGMGTNYYSKWFLSGSQDIFGTKRDGWNGSACIPQFFATYDADDTRKTDCWVWGPQKSIKDGKQIYINGKALNYTVDVYAIEKPGAASMQGARLKKYEIQSGENSVNDDDVPFFRLTDAYFIKAECLLRLGCYNGETEQTAADIITMCRKRDFKDHPEKAIRTVEQLKGPSVYDYGLRETQGEYDKETGELKNMQKVETHEGGSDIQFGGLLDDLAWEFVYEHHRRQDLIRFKMNNGCNVFNGKSWFGKSANTNAQDHHLDIFPILKDNLQANTKLKQNPGYN
jgi:hypothetical protein